MFVVCGEALWDFFGRERPSGLSFDARVGGSPFNVAVGLARLDQDVALLTGLSRDRLGERLFDRLEREGVSTSYLVRTERPTTLSLVDLGPDGSPVYAFYGEGTADRCVTEADLPAFGSNVWGFHVGSFSLVTAPTGSSLLALARREAGRRLITLDPNVRLNAEPDLAFWRARVDDFVSVSDVVKVSSEDLELLFPGFATDDVAARWLEAGAALVIVTGGASGADAYGAFGKVSEPGRVVAVADTVGAGDSFMAAMIARLAERGLTSRRYLADLSAEDVLQLLGFASDAAAITCSRRGADLPHRSDIGANAKAWNESSE
ncbi:carbohydrate kinase [Amorphus sp. 3PC139-8]|uniref:carbohydrate kinase family protein n=1 Tax=Amorphus sp. 3PC139-8 TaxID=2735676 RepID=UPI00345D365E